VSTLKALVATVALLGVAAVTACSSDDEGEGDGAGGTGATGGTSGTGNTSSSGGDGAGGDPTPAGSCIKPGGEGNELGIGTYCTPGGGECDAHPEAGLCLADVGEDQWFCTQIGCDATTDCGDGAGCLVADGQGSACVPCECSDTGIGCTGAGGAGSGGTGGGTGGV
jgi:hypothetical protein